MLRNGMESCRECMDMWQSYVIATAAYLEQKHFCEPGEVSRLSSESHQAKLDLLHHTRRHLEGSLAEPATCREHPTVAQVAQLESCPISTGSTALTSAPNHANIFSNLRLLWHSQRQSQVT